VGFGWVFLCWGFVLLGGGQGVWVGEKCGFWAVGIWGMTHHGDGPRMHGGIGWVVGNGVDYCEDKKDGGQLTRRVDRGGGCKKKCAQRRKLGVGSVVVTDSLRGSGGIGGCIG